MLALTLAFWSGVAAQVPRIEDQGIPLGPMTLYPSLSLEYSRDSNIFYRSLELEEQRIISSGVFMVRPRLLVDLPIGAQRISWSYAPLYRDYVSEDFSQSERISHFFDLDAAFRIGPSVRVSLKDHLVRATVELDRVDPGGELTFGLVPFVAHEPQADVSVDLGARHGLSMIAGVSSTDFDEAGSTTFFSYRRRLLEGRYNFRWSEPTTLYVFYARERTDQNREQILFSDVDGTSRRVGLGIRRMANQKVTSSLSLGYESLDFRGTQGQGFSGPVVTADTTWSLSDVLRLDLGLERRAYQSFFVNNDHYVHQAARVRIVRQLGQRAFWETRLIFQKNDYADAIDIGVTSATPPEQDADMNGLIDAFESLLPSVGLTRRDRIFRAEMGAAYLFHQRVRAFFGYNYELRNSNITEIQFGEPVDPFHYRVDRLVFRVEMGWL